MITSRQNRWVQAIQKSHAGRRRTHWLLEGPHLIDDALAADIELEAVLATPTFLDSEDARPLLPRLPRRPLEIDDAVLAEVTDSDSPRGIVALAARRRWTLDDVPLERGGVYVVADGIQDPGNLGALARTAEAAGCRALIAGPGSGAIDHPRALRASAGSLLRLAVASCPAYDALHDHFSEIDPTWIGLVPRDGHDVWQPLPGGTRDAVSRGTRVLVVGAEGPGLSADAASRLDLGVTIPMDGAVESLNATVAASIVLFEWRRQLRSAAQP